MLYIIYIYIMCNITIPLSSWNNSFHGFFSLPEGLCAINVTGYPVEHAEVATAKPSAVWWGEIGKDHCSCSRTSTWSCFGISREPENWYNLMVQGIFVKHTWTVNTWWYPSWWIAPGNDTQRIYHHGQTQLQSSSCCDQWNKNSLE